MINKIIRVILAFVGALGAYEIVALVFTLFADAGGEGVSPLARLVAVIAGAFLGGIIIYFLSPKIIRTSGALAFSVENYFQRIPTQDILFGLLGLISGLIIANLLGIAFYKIPIIGLYLPIFANLMFGYLGLRLALKRREDLSISGLSVARSGKQSKSSKEHYKILDTSTIIDGRIADIVKVGFLEGVLVVPSFVLEELRHIADSSDTLRRNRGRRGLDVLNLIQKESKVKVQIIEQNYDDILEVDSKLIRLAKAIDGKILTNDYNLNKVCELQGIEVLNINELANAVKPVVLPGEEMILQVAREGKESGQGVAYLDDGTMIVIENGRRFVGQTVHVTVSSVLQTAAGRMIFAKMQ
ncbi:MAG: PIN domain nuclease [bacterium]|nr:PIN domain nuclease [bacterium]